jgi:predicted dehydrogenase
MGRRAVGIAMNGVTGRMGHHQHLVRSILAIRADGGLPLDDGTVLWPEPLLVGRDPDRVAALAGRYGLDRWTVSLEEALADPEIEVYFDAQVTPAREAALTAAIKAGKHVYTEKPTAESVEGALALARLAAEQGVVNGVVQDKIFLPGLRKLRRLVEGGFFGRILSVRIDFGYWVFEGGWQSAQRPSWNYRLADGGGIILDMFPHWRYVLDNIIAPVTSVYAQPAVHLTERVDEHGDPYRADADDAAYAVLELEGGIIAQVTSSWATRVDRDELVEVHVDGPEGSAVAGLRGCRVQHRSVTPKPVWNPDLPATEDFRAQWQEVPDNQVFGNGFREEWEMFLRSVAGGEPFRYDLLEGAKGVQLARIALESARQGRRLAVPAIEV